MNRNQAVQGRLQLGFTMIEALASALIIMVGILAVIGMVMFAIRKSAEAQSASTAMATALTVVDDPTPLGTLDWTTTATSSRGYVNSYYVIRTISTAGTNPDLAANGLESVEIVVDVFDSINGRQVASMSTRRMARR